MSSELVGGSAQEGLACARLAGPESRKQEIRAIFDPRSDPDIKPFSTETGGFRLKRMSGQEEISRGRDSSEGCTSSLELLLNKGPRVDHGQSKPDRTQSSHK